LGQLHYWVTDGQGRDLAVLLFGPAAWKCAPRDLFIGWSAAQRQAHLKQVANNSRFLILPWVGAPRLASHVLSRVLRRLPQDWQSRQQLLALARTAPARLVEWALRLAARLRQVCRQRDALRRQVKALQARLALNSTNSSKPPSSDGLAKPAPKSLRQKTGRRPGGQPGHPGRTLRPVREPDHVRLHRLQRCPCGACQGRDLRPEPVLDYEKRQVFELSQKPLEVTEHRAPFEQTLGQQLPQAPVNHCDESGLRVEKTRQKVSGCFRTLHGARVFARIRSYISTCRKQGRNILDALEKALAGTPFIPSAPPRDP
jgi:hypothetical protein